MREEIQKIVDECVAQIGEHCDTVLILASQSESDNEGHFTDGYTGGTGDYYGRVGMATIYVEKQKAIARARAVESDANA